MEDDRKLELFERKMGLHELAGAIQSWGDVVVFTQGPKNVRHGIIIADTPGNIKESGDAYKAFLEEQIADGWGRMGVEEELHNLERRVWAKVEEKIANLTIEDKNERRYAIHNIEDTYAGTALGFAQFEGRIVHYLGMGLEFPWIILENLRPIELRSNHPRYDARDGGFSYRIGRIFFELRKHDVFLLKSDGLISNLQYTFHSQAKAYAEEHNPDMEVPLRDKIPEEIAKTLDEDYATTLVLNTVRKYQTGTAAEIRDGIVEDLGEYFSPLHDRRADVTFAVVKRAVVKRWA